MTVLTAYCMIDHMCDDTHAYESCVWSGDNLPHRLSLNLLPEPAQILTFSLAAALSASPMLNYL